MKRNFSAGSWAARVRPWLLLLLSLLAGAVARASAPYGMTQQTTEIRTNAARLSGMAGAGGEAAKAWFEWRTLTGATQKTAQLNAGSGTSALRVTQALTGLASGTTYQSRLVVSNASGVVYGAWRRFATGRRVVGWGDPNYYKTAVPAGVGLLADIAAGWDQSLAIKINGDLAVWGEGTFYGQTNIPSGLSNVVSVSGGRYHELAADAAGRAWAWGGNTYRQSDVPTTLAGVVAVAAGFSHSVALRSDGTAAAWGNNTYGQATVPTTLTDAAAIAASPGGYHTLALRANGQVVAWGQNTYSQSTVPAGLANVIAIAAGNVHSLALKADGTVVAWGRNNFGQITVPAGLSGVVDIAAAGNFSLALKSDGTVVAWGDGSYGQTTIPSSVKDVAEIAAGSQHGLALVGANSPPTALPQVVPAMANRDTIIKLTGTDPTSDPLTFKVLTLPAQGALYQSVGGQRGAAITAAGTPVTDSAGRLVFAPVADGWGLPYAAFDFAANDGDADSLPATVTIQIQRCQLAFTQPTVQVGANWAALRGTLCPNGFETRAWFEFGPLGSPAQATPALLVNDTGGLQWWSVGVSNLVAGQSYQYRLVISNRFGVQAGAVLSFITGGRAFAWGENTYAQTNVPATATNLIWVQGGERHNVGIRADGSVLAWGDNTYSQTSVPPGLQGLRALSSGWYHTLALKTDGSIVAWGINAYSLTNVPTGLSNIMAVAAGVTHNLALRSDGRVEAWGNGLDGQTVVPAGLTDVVSVGAGSLHSLVLRSDGSVVAWGLNTAGQAVVPSGLGNVLAISVGAEHNVALKADGTVVAWGNNTFGQCNVPADLGPVAGVWAGGYHSLALLPNGTFVQWGRSIGQPPWWAWPVGMAAAAAYHNLAIKENAGTPNQPPVAPSFAAAMEAGSDILLTLPGTDPDQDVLRYWIKTLPVNGQLFQVTTAGQRGAVINTVGTWVNDLQGRVIFAAPTSAAGQGYAFFDYVASDSRADSAPGRVTLNVAALPQVTLVTTDELEGNQGTHPLFVVVSLSSPSARESRVYYSTTNGNALADVDYLPVSGELVFAPGETNHAISVPILGDTLFELDETFSVLLSQPTNVVLSDTGIVCQILNDDPNPAPTAYGQVISGGANEDLVITLRGSDPNGDPLQFDVTTLPAAGQLYQYTSTGRGASLSLGSLRVTDPEHRLIFAPAAGAWGRPYANFGFKVTDGLNSSAAATVTISIFAPLVYTLAPTEVTQFSARLKGMANPNAYPAWAWFEWSEFSGPSNRSPVVELGDSTAVVPVSHLATGLASGENYACRLIVSNRTGVVAGADKWFTTGRKARGWGDTAGGQIAPSASLNHAVGLAAGAAQSFAILNDGRLVPWGNGSNELASIPEGCSNVVAASVGGQHVLALGSEGAVVAWGTNTNGQLDVPAGLGTIWGVAAGKAHSLALRADGTLAAWGANDQGQTSLPEGLSNVVAIAAGFCGSHNLALLVDGHVVAWGRNLEGQASVPASAVDVVSIAAGEKHSLALLVDGTVVAWGGNDHGQCAVPPNVVHAVAISAGANHSLAVLRDGSVVAWGENAAGQSSPPQFPDAVMAIAGGKCHSLAISGLNQPPSTSELSVTVDFSTDTTVALPGFDPDGDALQFLVTELPARGALYQSATTGRGARITSPGTPVSDPLGRLVFAPAEGFGTNYACFKFILEDGELGSTNAQAVIHVQPPLVTPPTIVSGPASQSVEAGDGVVFTAVVSGDEPLAYQWTHNGTPIAGATTSTLQLEAVIPAHAGPYAIAVSNPGGAVASDPALLTVLDTRPPVITNCAPPLVVDADAHCHFVLPDLTTQVQAGDLSGTLAITQEPGAGTVLSLGGFTVTLTARDAAGNASQCQTVVTVQDHLAPVFTVRPPDQTLAAGTNCEAAIPDLTAGVTASDCNGPVVITQSPSPGTLVGLGPVTVQFSVADAASNQATASTHITVVDVTPPTITSVPADQTLAAGTNCTASVPDYIAGISATDCGGAVTVTQNPSAGTLVGLGETLVTLTAKDSAGNLATATVKFFALDQTAPVITAVPPAQTLPASTNCEAEIPDLVAGVVASDCGGAVTITQSPVPGTRVGLGATNIAFTVVDAAGNTATAGTVLAIVDQTAPVITAVATDQIISASTNCQALVPDLVASVVASDCGGAVTVTQSPEPGTALGLGETSVHFSVKDPAGSLATATTKLTVVDVTPPVITSGPADQSLNADTNCLALVPDLTPAVAASDCSGAVTVTQTPTAGASLGLGETTVTLQAKDASGNAAQITAKLTVVDVTPPTFAMLPPNQVVPAGTNCQATLPDLITNAMATDCSGPVLVTQAPEAGTEVGLGLTNITLTARDAAGNRATTVIEVSVVDVTGPLITAVPADRILNAVTNCEASVPDLAGEVTATDCGGGITVVQSPAGGASIGLGENMVTFTVKDAAGNTSTATARLTVINAQPPAFVMQPVSATNAVGASVTFSAAVTSCTGVSYQWLKDGSPLPGGTNESLTIPAVQSSDAGEYSVVAANDVGPTPSAVALLVVENPSTPPVADFTPVGLDANGAFELRFAGGTNATYRIYATADLEQWEFAGVAEETAPGVYRFVDPSVTNTPSRFYRVGTP